MNKKYKDDWISLANQQAAGILYYVIFRLCMPKENTLQTQNSSVITNLLDGDENAKYTCNIITKKQKPRYVEFEKEFEIACLVDQLQWKHLKFIKASMIVDLNTWNATVKWTSPY